MFDDDDEIWDEHRWESFFRENDKMVDRYMEYMHRFLRDFPQPDEADEAAHSEWTARLDAYLAEKMGWDDADETEVDDLFDEDDEAWDLDDDPDAPSFERLPLYQRASSLADDVLRWAHELPGQEKDALLVEFCANTAQIGAAIARGSAFGMEKDLIGGNIASLKRGIASANTALAALQAIKHAPVMQKATYRNFYERLYEVRNDLGIYIQELRERFERGVD